MNYELLNSEIFFSLRCLLHINVAFFGGRTIESFTLYKKVYLLLKSFTRGQDITEFETKRLVSILSNNLLTPFRWLDFHWLFLFFKWPGTSRALHGNLSFSFLWRGNS